MQLNLKNGTISLTTAEARKASEIGSDLYNQLIKVKADFPNFEVKVISNKSKRTDTLKGLTYDYMEKYIISHGSEEQLKNFKEFCTKDEMNGKPAMPYGKIKKWFLIQFPEVQNRRAELKNKIAASVSTTKKEIA